MTAALERDEGGEVVGTLLVTALGFLVISDLTLNILSAECLGQGSAETLLLYRSGQ
jgi:hypothetical protein